MLSAGVGPVLTGGNTCGLPASEALLADPAAAAAQGHSARVHLIDLSERFCRDGVCNPVVGHGLIYRDSHHMTASFARTLAPFIGAAVK